jgi:hypothetical protein
MFFLKLKINLLVVSVMLAAAGCTGNSESLSQKCHSLVDETAFSKRWGEAFKPCLESAKRGDQTSQYWLADMYHSGHGTERSYEQAAHWWLEAAKQGHGPSQLNLAGLYRDGAGVLQDPVLAHMWYNLAATRGGLFDTAKDYREDIAEKLTPAQLTRAQEMAKQCLSSGYKNCE